MAAFSLRTQIAVVFTALLIGAAALLSFLLGERARQTIELHTSFTMVAMTDNLARVMARDLYQFSTDLLILANSPTLLTDGWASPRTRNSLERLRAMRSEFAWIGIADLRGQIRNASDGLKIGNNISAVPAFRNGLRNLYIGRVHEDPVLVRAHFPNLSSPALPYLDFAAPIRQGDQIVGVMGAEITWDWVRQIVDTLRPPESAPLDLSISIFDREGHLIYAPPELMHDLQSSNQQLPFTPSSTDENYAPHPERAAERAPSRIITWQDDRQYLTTVIRLPARNAASDLGWYVVNRMPTTTAFAEADLAARQALVLGIAIALFSGIMTWFAAGRISADLRRIAVAVQALRTRQASSGIPVLNSSAEVRVLSRTLFAMLNRLLKMRSEMEATIQQRTSELEAANYALTQQARTDALTGLLNRRGFDDQSRQILAAVRRNHQPLSVVMFDVDHFKRINDTLGHEVGDMVLQQLAKTLRHRLRTSDLLARMGGEEFLALLPDTDVRGAQRIADALVLAVAQEQHPRYGRITISAGVASSLTPPGDVHVLVRRADAALYEAKGQGRNRVCVDPASASEQHNPT